MAQKALRALRALKGRKARKEMSARLALRVPSGRLASFQGPWDRPPLSRGPRGRKAPKETMATLDRRAPKDCPELQASRAHLVHRARRAPQGRQELRDCQGVPLTQVHRDPRERKGALEPRAPRAEMEVPQ